MISGVVDLWSVKTYCRLIIYTCVKLEEEESNNKSEAVVNSFILIQLCNQLIAKIAGAVGDQSGSSEIGLYNR